jgi:hypothetical protein
METMHMFQSIINKCNNDNTYADQLQLNTQMSQQIVELFICCILLIVLIQIEISRTTYKDVAL